jgi:hypothetical protein
MDAAWWLTEMYGPRLSNSPQMPAFAYHTATREPLLPRTPLPRPPTPRTPTSAQ